MTIGSREVGWFIRLSKPFELVGGLLLYGLGLSIARFLGQPVDGEGLFLGLGITFSGHATLIYLSQYAAPTSQTDLEDSRNPIAEWSWVVGPDRLPPKVPLYASILGLTLFGLLMTGAFIQGVVPPIGWMILGLGFGIGLSLFLPPFRLATSGYGEFLSSFVLSTLVPLFAFVLQTGEVHRLIFMTTAPLITLQFALILNWQLPYFIFNQKRLRANLLARLGWSTTMWLHDLVIAIAFLLLTIDYVFGLSQRIYLGALIALPLGIAQIWHMRRVRNGFPPRWKIFTTSSMGLYAMLLYLLLLGFLRS